LNNTFPSSLCPALPISVVCPGFLISG
jgi:hypothetical protein